MFRLFVSLYLVIFVSFLSANDIAQKKANDIAESSKVFILNFAIDELYKQINRDMQTPYIKAIVVYDYFMKDTILSSYKENNLILQSKYIPEYLKRFPKIDVDIIQTNSYDKTKVATLSLYYDPSSLPENKQIGFTHKEIEYLNSKENIKMCVNPKNLPFEAIDKNGKYIGIGADIIKLIQKNSNIKFNLIKTKNWAESLEFIKNKQCDILPLAMKTDAKSSYLNFTRKNLDFPFVVLTNHSEIFVDNISELFNKKISIVKEYEYIKTLKNEFPKIELVEVQNLEEGIQQLRDKKVFAHIDTLAPLVYTLQKEAITDVKIAGKLEEHLSLSIASRKDEPILQAIMQKAINNLPDGSIQRIQNKWLAINLEGKIDFTMIYQLFLIFTIIFLISFWRYREIKKMNKIILEKNEELNKAYEKVSQLAVTDRLTKLYNRHKLDEVLQSNKELSDRYKNSFGVLLIDIDYFKQINDTFGHLKGDKALESLAKILTSCSRKTDTVGRWGGEEFLIVVPNVTQESIMHFAENLKTTVEKTDFDEIKKLTISIGVSIYKENESYESLISRSDKALYMSKSQGRNCVNFL